MWEAFVILLLILLNGFFAMSELAVVSSRRSRLQQMAEDGRKVGGAEAALRLAEDPSRFLSTVQIGITLIGIVAGAYGGATLAEPVGRWLDGFPGIAPHGPEIGFALVVAVITYLSLVVGELVPKRIAMARAEPIAAAVALPMAAVSRVAAPLVWLLGASTDGLLRLLGQERPPAHTVTEEEVRSLIAEGTQTGVFELAEKRMIDGVLRLSDRSVRAIMTPRPDVLWLDVADPPDSVAREIKTAGFSRFPVCRGDLDEVLGIVHAKDLLDRALLGAPFDLEAVMRKPLIVHDGTTVIRLLELFRETSLHLAVVVDEYGTVEGVVSVTDILEAIAGEMPELGEEIGIVTREDGSWLVDGMTPVDEVETLIGIRGMKGEGDFHTLAGFMLDRLGHVPKAAEHFVWQDVRFEVVDMDGRRIDKVLIAKGEGNER